jgi:hypothetical protein
LEENLLAFRAEWFNSDEFRPGGLHEKQAVAIWNLRTTSIPAFKPENHPVPRA